MAVRPQSVLLLYDLPTPHHPSPRELHEWLDHPDWRDERDVLHTLEKRRGLKIEALGVYNDLKGILHRISQDQPDLVFAMVESFKNDRKLGTYIPSVLELLTIPYTGANPQAMSLCRDKAQTKKILSYHGIKIPSFRVVHPWEDLSQLGPSSLPALIKPLSGESSELLSQGCLVKSRQKLGTKLEELRREVQTSFIIEQFIPGKDVYVALMGNQSPLCFEPRELCFPKAKHPKWCFATYKTKWDEAYRKKWQVHTRKLIEPPTVIAAIKRCSKKIYQILGLSGYARLDFRLAEDGQCYFLEANPNPAINKEDDFAQAALESGYTYPRLIDEIMAYGWSRFQNSSV